MAVRRRFLHVAVWSGAFVFWLLTTRNHHPTLTIALLATIVLVGAFALAVYVNALFLLPRFARPRLWLQYAFSLLAIFSILDLGAVLLIQFIYDRLWGPDPLRYGFWFNVASEGVLILVHLAAAMGIMRFARYLRRRKSSAQPIIS